MTGSVEDEAGSLSARNQEGTMRLFSFTHTLPDKCSQTLLRSPVRHNQDDLFLGTVLELCRVLSVPVCTRCCGAVTRRSSKPTVPIC